MPLLPPNDDVETYLKSVFEALKPAGRTDLYGSFYQACEWVQTRLGAEGQARIFLLTDGEHNCISRPQIPAPASGTGW